MVSMGLAQAGSIRVSNAFGSGNWMRIGLVGKSTLYTAVAYGLFCAIMFGIFRNVLPSLFNKNTEVMALASLLILYAAVFQISDSTQAIGAGLLRGIKDVKMPTVLIAIAYWVIGLPIGYLLGIVFNLGAPGMWMGLILGLSFASLFLFLRFMKMHRKNKALTA
jgi:MATE family multidrug resistance protein